MPWGGRGVALNENDLFFALCERPRERYLQRAVSEEVALERGLTAGQALRRQVLVRQEREPTEAEAPVEFVQSRCSEGLVGRGSDTGAIRELVLHCKLGVQGALDVVPRHPHGARFALDPAVEVFPPVPAHACDHGPAIGRGADPFAEQAPAALLASRQAAADRRRSGGGGGLALRPAQDARG